jgi:hypothetical protein
MIPQFWWVQGARTHLLAKQSHIYTPTHGYRHAINQIRVNREEPMFKLRNKQPPMGGAIWNNFKHLLTAQ